VSYVKRRAGFVRRGRSCRRGKKGLAGGHLRETGEKDAFPAVLLKLCIILPAVKKGLPIAGGLTNQLLKIDISLGGQHKGVKCVDPGSIHAEEGKGQCHCGNVHNLCRQKTGRADMENIQLLLCTDTPAQPQGKKNSRRTQQTEKGDEGRAVSAVGDAVQVKQANRSCITYQTASQERDKNIPQKLSLSTEKQLLIPNVHANKRTTSEETEAGKSGKEKVKERKAGGRIGQGHTAALEYARTGKKR